MRLYLLVLLSGLLFYACSQKTWPLVTEAPYLIPPGTERIDSNLFVDVIELTNIAYKEYQFHQKGFMV